MHDSRKLIQRELSVRLSSIVRLLTSCCQLSKFGQGTHVSCLMPMCLSAEASRSGSTAHIMSAYVFHGMHDNHQTALNSHTYKEGVRCTDIMSLCDCSSRDCSGRQFCALASDPLLITQLQQLISHDPRVASLAGINMHSPGRSIIHKKRMETEIYVLNSQCAELTLPD